MRLFATRGLEITNGQAADRLCHPEDRQVALATLRVIGERETSGWSVVSVFMTTNINHTLIFWFENGPTGIGKACVHARSSTLAPLAT
jgi:hypothetical protein